MREFNTNARGVDVNVDDACLYWDHIYKLNDLGMVGCLVAWGGGSKEPKDSMSREEFISHHDGTMDMLNRTALH